MKEKNRPDGTVEEEGVIYWKIKIPLNRDFTIDPEKYPPQQGAFLDESIPLVVGLSRITREIIGLNRDTSNEIVVAPEVAEDLIERMHRVEKMLRPLISYKFNGNGKKDNRNGHGNNGSIEKEDASKKAIVY